MARLSADEQYLLELINRARLNPADEAKRYGIDLNQGLASGQISTASKQPLAGNDLLTSAARDHSDWMLAADTFSHTGLNGSDPGGRMWAAGYAFTGSWAWGENIAWNGTTGTPNPTQSVADQHASLIKSPGHRENIMNDGFREVGIGVKAGEYKGYNTVMTTEDFAKSGASVFVTGVAYTDRDGDHFYSPSEGLGGVRVDLRPPSGAATPVTTQTTGGYEALTPVGICEVGFSGGGLATPVGLTLSGVAKNVKLDLIGSDSVACSASVALGTGLKAATLLGTEDLQATGNGLDNVLTGNAGNNVIAGGGGGDMLTGAAGNDTFVLRAGEANGDRVVDFSGNGALAGDFLRFEGYDAAAKLTSLGGGRWQIADGARVDTITVSDAVDGSDYGFFASGGGSNPPPNPSSQPTPDPVTGTPGNDLLVGNSASNTLGGGLGDDRLYGYGGNDTFFGGPGNDSLSGGNGNDVLVGGAGVDRLNGGLGADRFVFRSMAEAGGTVGDFQKASGDRLDLAELFDALGYGGANSTADGHLRAVQAGSAVRVDVDAGDGDGFATLATLLNTTASALDSDYFLA